MDDPAKIMGAQMAETNRKLSLEQAVKEGQRLLKLCIKQRNNHRAFDQTQSALMRSIMHHWSFFLLPSWLKKDIIDLALRRP